MKEQLFDIPESLSPKLRWLKKHGLVTMYDKELVGCHESPETGETCHPWIVAQEGVLEIDRFVLGAGDTEEEAILDYCSRAGLPHYSVSP